VTEIQERNRRPGAIPAAAPATDETYQRQVDDVVGLLRRAKVLPVATIDNPVQVERVCRALDAGGVGCIEIAFRTPAAADPLARARAVHGFLLGAGTVLTVQQARAAAEAGADFAVAPGLNEEIVATCHELGLPFFPGVATPSEIDRARRLGLSTLKVFPAAELGGPAFLRAVSAAFSDVGFLPTGGVDASTLGSYLAVPSVVACAGSWLVRRDLIANERFDEIERLAHEAKEVLQ
jgi:2-dehydro-3-deoxyphosphogluconate aldolase/(4S)-4-hydroxy-2-oxoglutarate aldolase